MGKGGENTFVRSFIAVIREHQQQREASSREVISRIHSSRPEWTSLWEYMAVLNSLYQKKKDAKHSNKL